MSDFKQWCHVNGVKDSNAGAYNAWHYQLAEIERLNVLLFTIANIAHHGELMGQGLDDIRRLTLPCWDKQVNYDESN